MKLLLIPALLALAACSVLPKPQVETRYVLQPATATATGQGVTLNPSNTLRIARPEVPLAYRSSQLALVKDGEQTFYAGKSWESPLPDLLQSALIRDLSTLKPNWVVSSETSGIASTYELQTDVRTFATLQNGKEAKLVLDINLRLLATQERKVTKVIPFHYEEQLPNNFTTVETISAYQRGWQALLKSLQTF